MESNQNTQKKVGLFILIGLIVTFVSIFLVGGDRAFIKDYQTFYAYFDQVQGIAKGSVVSLAGINVGNVKKITFVPEKNTLAVEFKVNEEYAYKLTEGSSVEVRTQGALGDKFLFINPGPLTANKLKPESVLPIAKASDIMSVIGERGGEVSNVFEILKEVHVLLKTINDGNKTNKILDNLANATSSLNQTAIESQKLIAEVRGNNELAHSVRKLDSILTKIDKGEGTLGALINDPSVHEQIKGMLGGSGRKKAIKSLLRTSIEKAEE